MAVVAGVQEIPMIGYWATSPSLADKNTYPTLARADPADDSIATAQADFFKAQNYTRVALLFVNDAFGVGFKDSLFTECTKRGILLHFIGFNPTEGFEDSVSNAMNTIKNLKLNVISLVAYPTQHDVIANVAVANGLVGKNKQWVFLTYGDGDSFLSGTTSNVNYRKLLNGSVCVTPTILDDGGLLNTPWQKWLTAWPSFEKYRAKLNTIYPRADGYDAFDLTYPANFFQDTQSIIAKHMAFEYDAIIAMGLAMCKANSTGKANGNTVFKKLLSLDFTGLSGNVKFLANGNRDPNTITYLMQNVRDNDADPNGNLVKIIGGTWTGSLGWVLKQSIKFSSGTNTPPAAIDIPTHNRNLIPSSAKIFGYVLFAFTLICCLAATIWLAKNRKERLVNNSQPIFLFLLLVGVVISNLAILPIMVDEGSLNAVGINEACMMFPWLITIGFMLSYVALFTKTYRILLLFHNPSLKKRVISAKPSLAAVVFVLIAESVVLIAWTIEAPLKWQREIKYEDMYGNPTESMGACVASSSNTLVYVGLLITFHAISLGFGAYVSTAAREIPQEFQESKWIALAMGSTLQIFLIGIPTVVATYTTSSFARFMSFLLIIFVSNIAMIGFIFVPKMFDFYIEQTTTRTLQTASRSANHQSVQASFRIRDGGAAVSAAPQSSAIVSGNLR